MSIFGAMFSGVSGLSAQSTFLGMISDNISNVNTVGYKGSVSRFSTLVTKAATAHSFSPGGVQSNTTQRIDQQGLLQSSTSQTDVAIVGQGFFVVNESNAPGLGDEYLYTRAGSFKPDENGFLKNTAGYYLMGWPTDSTGAVTVANQSVLSSTQPVSVTGIAGSALATSTASLGLNLPATDAVAATHNASIQVFDSLGVEHSLTVTFTKTGANAWNLTAADPVQVGGGVSGTTTLVGSPVAVTFNADGTLAGPASATINITGWTTGAANSSIALSLGTVGASDGLTQFANDYQTYFIKQNGVRFGIFNGVSIDENGLVTALFDNGQTTPIYKVPVGTFNNPNGLQGITGNVFRETDTSGTVVLNAAGTGSAGSISPSSLEASNIDVASEFTNMIITQQAYSASAQIITTANQMLDEVIRIVR
jgi:flagellar hook protein FlgE